MLNRSAAASHQGMILLAAAELVLHRQTGSFFGQQFDVYFRVPAKYLAGGMLEGGMHTVAAQSSTSFQVFHWDNNILAHAIMSQKSPYSKVITNI